MQRIITTLIACCVLSGCATVNEMAFDKKTSSIDTTSKSVVLMTIDVSRDDESRFVPKPIVVKLETPGAQSKEDRQNFKITKNDAINLDGHKIYLTRIALSPGTYKLREITGMASAFPINSFFAIPLETDLTIRPNSITYIGHVTAKLRTRKDGEFRAGPFLPLIDQAVSGMSGSTWDISIDDMSEKDIALFRANYKVLQTAHIETVLLPPFDRQAVQRIWDGQTNEMKSASTAPLLQESIK